MKSFLKYSLLFFALILASCNKWMDVIPENEQISDRYWANKEEVEAVLGSGYVKLQKSIKQLLIWGEARGNGLALAGFVDADLLRLKMFDVTPSNELVKWGDFYTIINYANMVLKYAPEVVARDPSFSESVMQSYLAEARFLRALSYFYLVRNFRDVPLILDPYMDDQTSFELAKSPQNVVFAQIITDLEGAIQYSKEIWPTDWETKGRATKWAIYATLADVYLWTGEYDKAIIACNAVMNSGRVGLIQGMVNNKNNWFTIFNPGNSNEGIFEIQFDNTKSQTNDLVSWFGTSYNWTISAQMVTEFQWSSEDIRAAGATYSEADYKIWKYLGAEAGTAVPRTYSDQHWIIYRMADIYLMKAEALVMKGAEYYAEATKLVNQIRTRAGISEPLSSASTELEMLDMVLHEKALEFIGEGKRWYDLLRVAQRNNYAYKEYLISQVLSGIAGGSAPVIRSKLLNVNSHYLPIYIDELRANALLEQNPYYDNLN